jgi:hypothetical protein
MNSFEKDDLSKLLETRGGTCVSLYLPTARAGKETLGNPTRLRNLLRDARQQMEQTGMEADAAERLLQPAAAMDGDYGFWQNQEEGLAIFISAELSGYLKLPFPPEEVALVANAFHIGPLIPFLSDNFPFFVLSLDQHHLTLHRATRWTIEEVELEGVPTSISEALQFDDPEQSLQHHGGAKLSGAVGHSDAAGLFHGHGGGDDDHKMRLLRFFQLVDRGLHAYFREEKIPLVLAGVEYYGPIYREANTYAHLVDDKVVQPSNPRGLDSLREAAWEVVRPQAESIRERRAEEVAAGLVKRMAVNTLPDAVAAAHQGRAAACFIAEGERRWGTYDEVNARVELLDRKVHCATDLLDYAAAHTLQHGGEIYRLPKAEMPGGTEIAVLLRYPLQNGPE